MGLLEVCWVYFLPALFSVRKYALPTSTFGWFVLIAIVIDVAFVLLGVTLLGLVISVIRRVWKRSCSFGYWNASIRFLLIAGILTYLYRGYLYMYVLLEGNPKRTSAAMIGILVIILFSICVVWFLEKLNNRFGKKISVGSFAVTVLLLTCLIIPNYLHYRSKTIVETDIPLLSLDHKPNILLVTLDTLRADHLSCYGNKIVKTPALDSLAADGYLFEKAFCQVPYTTPSHCSIMTSTYMSQHGAFNGSAMKENLPTIAEILQKNGYNTAAFVSSAMVTSGNSGLNRGFEYYEDSLSPYSTFFRHDEFQLLLTVHKLSYLSKLKLYQIPGSIVSERAMSWLRKKREGPFFCWLHYYDPHTPYDAPQPYKDMYKGKLDPELPMEHERTRYAGEVTYTDAQLARVIKLLKETDLYNDTLIIVTSDHGEAFGEKHGKISERDHGFHLYDTTLHVPLIIKLPNEKNVANRIPNLVQLLDIAPTILDLMGASSGSSFKGKSLVNLLKGKKHKEKETVYSETASPLTLGQANQEILNARRLMSLRNSKIKYIRNVTGEREELYNIASDPAETINIISKKSELAKSCYESIIEVLGEPAEAKETELDPMVLEQLRSLGYLDSE